MKNNILYQDAEQILSQNLDWNKLKDSKVLVTGASGMLGSYITRTLCLLKEKNNWNIDVYALVRNPQNFLKTCKGRWK